MHLGTALLIFLTSTFPFYKRNRQISCRMITWWNNISLSVINRHDKSFYTTFFQSKFLLCETRRQQRNSRAVGAVTGSSSIQLVFSSVLRAMLSRFYKTLHGDKYRVCKIFVSGGNSEMKIPSKSPLMALIYNDFANSIFVPIQSLIKSTQYCSEHCTKY